MKAAAALGVAALLTAGCVSPAWTSSQYQGKATKALEAATSEVATTRLTVQQQLDHKVLGTFADEVVTSSETAMGAISDAFGSVQPPDPASDSVRDEVSGQLSDAGDAVAHARIAVRRGDPAALRAVLEELDDAARGIDALEGQLS